MDPIIELPFKQINSPWDDTEILVWNVVCPRNGEMS